ncbi:MAG: TetR family transcriptional regulator [Candidatus Dormibacteraceae bacterium]
MQETSGRRGRWRTGVQSRRRILDAARSAFGERGYDRTTIRAIAAEAKVDPAMVHYFFETKAQLFSMAMELPTKVSERLTAQLQGGVDGLGERLIRHFLQVWDEEAAVEPLLALMRSAATDARSASMFVEFMEREIVVRLRDTIGGEDAHLRAQLIGSHLMGLALLRYVVRLEPLASTPPEAIAVWMGAVLQRYLSGTPRRGAS